MFNLSVVRPHCTSPASNSTFFVFGILHHLILFPLVKERDAIHRVPRHSPLLHFSILLILISHPLLLILVLSREFLDNAAMLKHPVLVAVWVLEVMV